MNNMETKKKRLYFVAFMIASIVCYVVVFVIGSVTRGGADVLIGGKIPINSINGTLQTFAFTFALILPCLDGKSGMKVGAILSAAFTLLTLASLLVLHNPLAIPGVINGIFTIAVIIIIGTLIRNIEKKTVTDLLTNLLNLRGFFEVMDKKFKEKKPFSLAIIQINNFRNINDEYGHSVGDAAIKISGERIKEVVGEKGEVSRITGAEFAIIVNGEYDAESVVRDCVKKIGERMEISAENHSVNCYLEAIAGIAEYPKDAKDKDELVKWADIAQMHAAESDGYVAKFDEEMYSDLLHREEIEQLIKEALTQDYFYFVYQPQYSVTDKKLRGFESLIRMKLPDGRVVSPAEFIPIAEMSNLIYQIDEYAIERALKEFAPYVNRKEKIMVSVNISANGFAREEFVPFVEKMLEKYNFPSECLEIEITEYSFAVSQEQTLNSVHGLKEKNIQIALDDFGTGYTSLSQLMNLSANLLKVDKSLVDDIAKSELNSDFVKSIGSMGHLLDCEVVLEGVESEDQVDVIKRLNCDYIQGYVWSKPVSYDEAIKMVN